MTPDIDEAYPRLETARLVLRALRMEDADFIFKEWGDPVVTHYMRDEEPLKTREQAEEMLLPLQTPEKMPDFKWWGIEIKAEGRLIGTCGYCRWDKQHHRAEIGYDLWPDYWGQGLMPEALQALIRFGFEEMDLNRIEATTHTENRRSQRVLAKLGFQREGLLREYYCRDDVYNDQVQFSLLRREWQQTIAGLRARPGTLRETRQLLEQIDLNAAIISAIIEREHVGETQVLIQTRWKPDRDPEYSGTLEIPAGGIHVYENVYEAVKREVLEETGLHVKSFYPDVRTEVYAPREDDCFAFVPFCCQQQLRGGIPRIGIVFICRVEDEEPVPEQGAVQDIVWMSRSELCRILDTNPERIFTLQLPVLDYYLRHHRG